MSVPGEVRFTMCTHKVSVSSFFHHCSCRCYGHIADKSMLWSGQGHAREPAALVLERTASVLERTRACFGAHSACVGARSLCVGAEGMCWSAQHLCWSAQLLRWSGQGTRACVGSAQHLCWSAQPWCCSGQEHVAVSYTHLTLPTIFLV